MDAIVDLSWRAYPPGAIAAFGLLASARGLALLVQGWRRSVWDRDKNLVWMTGFRLTIVGLAVVALAAAWQWQQLWVLLIALAIAGEETLETSMVIFALRRSRRLPGSWPKRARVIRP
jgi:hypothetical protein